MNRLKTILQTLVLALSMTAGGAQAALVDFTLLGTVGSADTSNGFGLDVSDLITVTGTFDDSALTNVGSEDVLFSMGSGNSLNLVLGSKSFTETDDIQYSSGGSSPKLRFLDGAFDGFNFRTEFGTLGYFLSVGFSFDSGDDNFYPNYVSGTWTSYTVSAVPVPAAVWLFGSGLLGLVGVARRRR